MALRLWWTLLCSWGRFATTLICSIKLRWSFVSHSTHKSSFICLVYSSLFDVFLCSVLQESFSEHLGFTGGVVQGYVEHLKCEIFHFHWFSVIYCVLYRLFVDLICTVPPVSLSCWTASCQSSAPPTTKCCSSVRWPRSWPSWRTTSPTATSNTCAWTVSRFNQVHSESRVFCVSWEKLLYHFLCVCFYLKSLG